MLVLSVQGLLRADVPVYPGPSYDENTQTGFTHAEISDSSGVPLNFIGQAIGMADKYINGDYYGTHAFRWDPTGAITEMGHIGTDSNGVSYATAYAINAVQDVAGIATKYVNGVNRGDRAVRWDVNGTPLELEIIGTNVFGVTNSGALAINSSGDMVGFSEQWIQGNSQGVRPVRWNSAGNLTEMNVLGTNHYLQTEARAYSINNNGVSTGYCEKYVNEGIRGRRPVRWTSSGQVTELPVLGTDVAGLGFGAGLFINSAGDITGWSQKFDNVVDKGQRAVLWNHSGAMIELSNLGEDNSGFTTSIANHMNDLGDIVGTSDKYVSGVNKGYRAVRWDTLGNITELANLGTDMNGVTHAEAFSINSIGQIAGYAEKYSAGNLLGRRAMVWQADGSAIDLNTLIANSNKWVFNTARSITTTGWVSGVGTYDPDSIGPLSAYSRVYTIKITNDVVWTNPTGGAWHTDGNWSTGFAPGQTLGTTFNLPNTYTVSLTSDAEIANIGITAGTITYALNNHTLTSTGQVNMAGGNLTISGGKLKTAGLVSKGAVTINNGATLEITSLGDEVGVSAFKQLTIPANAGGYDGTIQLHVNDLVVDYDGYSSPYEQIIAMVRSGLAILGGNGTGIASDAVDNGFGYGTMLGVLDNGAIDGSFQSVSGFRDFSVNSVILKYTWFGDANLDGVVNGDDYALVDTGYTDHSLHGWVFGDMDYNGVVDNQDYALTDTGFIAQSGSLPEPFAASIFWMFSMLLLKRRPRYLAG